MKFKKKIDDLTIKGFTNRTEMGRAAASDVAARISQLLETQDIVNMVFAAAPSQNEFLDALTRTEIIDWRRINAFHMDEYIGLPEHASQRFGNFLKEQIFTKLPFHAVHYLDGNNPDPQDECLRYTRLLEQHPTDIVCMGIGENCHIAFNDPHVADFDDPKWVKMVDLDLACRQQQVNDKCFDTLEEVPLYALTLTIPALMRAPYVYCIVPGMNKAVAVHNTVTTGINALHPSTILRKHPKATLYVDEDSASLLKGGGINYSSQE